MICWEWRLIDSTVNTVDITFYSVDHILPQVTLFSKRGAPDMVSLVPLASPLKHQRPLRVHRWHMFLQRVQRVERWNAKEKVTAKTSERRSIGTSDCANATTANAGPNFQSQEGASGALVDKGAGEPTREAELPLAATSAGVRARPRTRQRRRQLHRAACGPVTMVASIVLPIHGKHRESTVLA